MSHPTSDWLTPSPQAHPIGPLHCNEPYQDTLQLVSNPRGIRTTNQWARLNRPSEYTCNLRPGLPLWLFWTWHAVGVPIRGVIVGPQLNVNPTDSRHNTLLSQVLDAWEVCTWQEVHPSPKDRDIAVATYGKPVTMTLILSGHLAHAQSDTHLMEEATAS